MTTALMQLEALELPGSDGKIDWESASAELLHDIVRGAFQLLFEREPATPSPAVLERSILLEETLRTASPLQYHYVGLLQDGFNDTTLRHMLNLPEGKTAFRDATDLVAKTHGIRANEAASRLRLAQAITPARASDPERTLAVGDTQLPMLSAFQGRVNPSKLASALSMIDAVDTNAQAAGKDEAYRSKLRDLMQRDLAEKIEHTTPEEFSRYVGQRKRELLAAVDPSDQQFTKEHTETMYDVRRVGPVRGNQDAIEYRVITDAEGDETIQTVLTAATNPRGQDNEDTAFETRSRGHRRMHALRDALKFVLANLDKTGFRGASGAHTQLLVMTDHATLLDGLRTELAEHLPEIHREQRERLLELLARLHTDNDADTAAACAGDADAIAGLDEAAYLPDCQTPLDRPEVSDVPWVPPPKTTNVADLFDDDNLDRLQPRVSQGIYTKHLPPDVIWRIRCDVGITPITLTGRRQVLSIGRQQRQFSAVLRRAILLRDRGCAVPGCHIPAALCEIHHVIPWARDGVTSTDNGLMLCSHHHAAVHVKALTITRIDGEFRFVLHPLIDATQQPRKNHFFQS